MEYEVCVIMPVYNAAPFLRKAIDSVLAQTYSNFQLLLINDGSTDESESIIRSYSDKRILYHTQQNSGVAATLNRAVGMAASRYIWRHDADDISLPDKLAKQVAFLESHPDYALCACQVAFMTESGKVAWNYKQPNDSIFKGREFLEVKRQDFNPYSPITHGTVLIRTDVMKGLGGYRKEFITGEDVDLWLRLIQQYKAAVLNECLSLHRLSARSATQVHGWKNEFFRNLAFEYYEQRKNHGVDDLAKGKAITLPPVAETPAKKHEAGKNFRGDLLLYHYPLHLNAKDWTACRKIVTAAIKEGWKVPQTWKAIIFPIIGKRIVHAGVRLKALFRK